MSNAPLNASWLRFRQWPKGWQVLTVYAAVAGVSQMLWLNFAPLIALLQQRYGVSEFEASLPTLVFPLFYVVLSLHAGAMVDHRGFKFTVGFGSILMAVASLVRIHDAYWSVLVGQIGIAIGQPYVLNGISKLVGDWFSEEETALATGLGTVGMFVGCALGMALTPALVGINFELAMSVFAAITIACTVAFLRVAEERPAPQRHLTRQSGFAEFRGLLKNRQLVLVFALSFLGLGFFNGLTTWLEGILAPNGISAEDAGLIGGVFILGGIAGAILVPALSDRLRRRKPFLLLCLICGLALLEPLCSATRVVPAMGYAVLLGFAFLPAYALLLAMSEELAGAEMAGMATGILMMVGNAGGVVVIILMDVVHSDTWQNAIYLMFGILLVSLAIAAIVRETFVKHIPE